MKITLKIYPNLSLNFFTREKQQPIQSTKGRAERERESLTKKKLKMESKPR